MSIGLKFIIFNISRKNARIMHITYKMDNQEMYSLMVTCGSQLSIRYNISPKSPSFYIHG